MGETEDFNTLAFEKRLMQLKDTQESIQSLSSWCLKQREHHKKVVSSWLNVLKRVKVEQRLVLFYLANDVIQYSKRKNYEFVESWGLNLQKATPLVRDDKVRPKILRIFKIWEQRSVYDDEFLSDLTGLLSAGAVKKTDDDPLDFQPQQLVNKIKQCTVLEADTDLRLKYIHESHLQLSDADALRASLKDKSNKDDVEKELNEGIACVERYTAALQREIVAREALLALLTSADQYYSTQRQEVKVVAYAYKNFGARVRALKRKLDELIPTLPNAAPSPPQRDEDVPSPGPDEDLELPTNADNGDHEDIAYNIDRTFNSTVTADGSLYNFGLTSFLSSDNPMSIFNDSSDILNSANKIEVINSRPNEKQGFDINEVLKPYMSNDSTNNVTDNSSVNSTSISQKSQDALPGLDLLTPESTGNPPPVSFYGTIDITDDTDEPYVPEMTSPWVNNWTIPRIMDTPESPPPVVVTSAPPEPRVYSAVQEVAPSHAADIDQRGILPPPPPPPALPLLGNIEDVDHRLLPNLPPPPPVPAPIRHPVQQDVDHRNLISLTHQPAPAPLPVPAPRLMNPINLDQDYRVPPMVPPPDIVESVDMDLSEDEEQQGMYPNQKEPTRRHSFNNNKVLVGGDNGKTNHNNLIPIKENKEPLSAPAAMPPLVNPFDSMPPNLKDFNLPNIPFNKTPPPNFNQNPPPNFSQKPPPNFNSTPPPNFNSNPPNPNFNSNPPNPNFNFEEDEDNSFVEDPRRHDNETSNFDGDWDPRGFTNQRFPRNWAPRTNFRPPGFGPQQWPRGGPRPPNRWMGPRQRFW